MLIYFYASPLGIVLILFLVALILQRNNPLYLKKFLRFIGILFMGITTAVTLIGGVGTTCVALNPTAYESMKAIANYQWLYILYVLIGVALGVLGIRSTIQLARKKAGAEKTALYILIAGVVVGAIHMFSSRALRGSSMPVDGVVYITVITLIVFLLFRLPKVREMGLFEGDADSNADTAGGVTAFAIGAMVLSVQVWAGPTHLLGGVNYADAFHNAMLLVGVSILLYGIGLIGRRFFAKAGEPVYKFNK